MITENDRRLLDIAAGIQFDGDYIEPLIPKADSEETKARLREMARDANRRERIRAFL